jgi:hypothetical protein
MDDYSPAQKELFRILDIISLERTETLLKEIKDKYSSTTVANTPSMPTEIDDNVME